MNRSRSPLVVVAMAGLLAAVAALGGPAAAADARPTAVVALGDSAASGDGAGDYEPGTRGENGNWCHRSTHAYINHTGLAEQSVNLACSGADAAAVAFGGSHNTEGSQAQRLIDVATRRQVTTVVLQVGANDDAALTATGISCIAAFLDLRRPPCRDTIGPLVGGRMAATAPKVEAAVHDVREAMRRAGYADDGYQLVLMSYASPVTEHAVLAQALQGCPYSKADAGWGRTTVFPALSAALAGVAQRTGARFLDMARATEGREACSRPLPADEWQRRITVDPQALVHGGLDAVGFHLAQESFHPNAAAHAEMARCLADFVRSPAAAASCVTGADGRNRVEAAHPAPAAA